MKNDMRYFRKMLGFVLSAVMILESSGIQVLAEELSADLSGEETVYVAVNEGNMTGESDGITVSEGNAVSKSDVMIDSHHDVLDSVSEIVMDEADIKEMTEGENIASGTWRGMAWIIDNDGVLIISGNYEYDENGYSELSPAWLNNMVHKESIVSARVTASEVKSTSGWFRGCYNLQSIDFSDFDTSQVTDMSSMFYYCESLTSLDVSSFDTSQVTDMSDMFSSCHGLTSLDLGNFNTSQVTDMSGMFSSCDGLTSLDLGNFNIGQVTDMSKMFSSCTFLTSLDLSSFSTSQVTDMSVMFDRCESLTSLNVSNFDTSQVTNMREMFGHCYSLTSLDLSKFDTSQVKNMSGMFGACSRLTSLYLGSSFDTSQVTDMSGMFGHCESLTSLDVSNFDTSQVTDMSGMFNNCSSLTSLDVSNFDTSQVADMSGMFYNCSGLTSLNLSSFDLSGLEWVEDDSMFSGCISLEQLNTPKNLDKSIDLPRFMYDENGEAYLSLPRGQSTSIRLIKGDSIALGIYRGMDWSISGSGALVISGTYKYDDFEQQGLSWMDYSLFITSAKVTASGVQSTEGWFSGCTNLKELELYEFDTSQVTDMNYMFRECSTLIRLDISNFDTRQVTNMNGMFSGCKSLTSLDLSSFDTSQVTDMSHMFDWCESLTGLDLSGFDTNRVTDMSWLFSSCRSLTSLDLSKFDTSQVRDMSWMFSGCRSLISLDLSKFDTSQVRDMSEMFGGCTSLTSLDVSKFNTSQVRDMSDMFWRCTSLTSLDVSKFDTSQVRDMSDMFGRCESLTSLDVSNFDTNQVAIMNYMFEHCYSLVSLDMSGFDTSQVTEGMVRMLFDCDSLEQLDTPKNVTQGVALPHLMYDENGTEYSILPMNQETSIRLTCELEKSCRLAPVPAQTYTGSAIEPEVTVTYGAKTLTKGTDYTVTYANNINAAKSTDTNAPTVTVTCKGDYTGTLKATFTIQPKTLTDENTTVSPTVYAGAGIRPVPGVTVDGIKLVNDRDFTVEYPDITEEDEIVPGSYSVLIKGMGNYQGTIQAVVEIQKVTYSIAPIPAQTYTGSAIEPEVTVTFGSVTLVPVTDYTVTYANNVNAAKADDANAPTVTVECKGDYTGTLTATFTIEAKTLTKENTMVSSMEYDADGEAKKPVPDVTVDGLKLVNGKDFTVEYPDTGADAYIAPGTYNVLIKGQGNYQGSITVTMEIVDRVYRIAPIPAQDYTGKAIKPEVTVTYGRQNLTPGTDYTVTYKNNTNAANADAVNAPAVTVKGKGNFTGTLTATFTIEAKELTEDNTTISSMVYIADGKTKQTNPTVTLDGKKLIADKDFTVGWPDAKNANGSTNDKAYKEPGRYSVVIKGQGNYQGTLTATLAILTTDQVPASKLKVASIPAQTYTEDGNGKVVAATPIPKVTYGGKELKLNQDYKITYRNNDRAGKAALIITGLENTAEGGTYICGTLEKTFTIKGTAISKAKLTYQESGTASYSPAYTGSEICPTITLTVGEKTLKENKDYTIVYTNNIKAGKATIILTGIGGYTGTAKKTFTIKPASDVADRLKVTFAGGIAQASYSQSGAKPVVIVTLGDTTLESGKDYTMSYKNNKNLAAADAAQAPTITIKGKGNYKFQKNVTFAIVEKDLKDENITIVAPDKFVGGKGSMLSVPVVTDGNGKKLKANKDYTVIGYEVDGKAFDGAGTLAAGTTITVKLAGTGSYKGETSTTYRIVSMDLSKAKVNKPKLEYNNGEEVVFTEEMLKEGILTVTYKGKDASGNKVEQALTYSKDYIITGYKNNIKKGTATVTIRGTGEYGGTKAVKFSIVSKMLK